MRNKLTKEGNDYYSSLTPERKAEEFKLLPAYQSIFHTFTRDDQGNVNTFGQNNNTKYIQPILGYEVVLDANKQIVTDPLNAGTYNFYNPTIKGIDKSLQGLLGNDSSHLKYDYDPYVDLGNAPKPQDPTSYWDRFNRKVLYPLNRF